MDVTIFFSKLTKDKNKIKSKWCSWANANMIVVEISVQDRGSTGQINFYCLEVLNI